ncbi:cell division protein FtsZ [Oricola cellulosilytica]|uniref:Cell division protein FtsZ n=1 Tax=Oricola cellulosilytica TaxID=1429082 RepID=A0A4R0PD62_9HYPH|nr:cell division protein FtsZ [Oricola cellulosilytica]TCD15236.1 cell division protein FtsZ [Oricola cellulosilytica]
MTINLQKPDITELKPRITVFGVGGGGGNAVNNMINAGLEGVDFVVANTDAQALTMNKSERIIQLGLGVTEGLGAGSQPDVGRSAAEECIDEINDHLNGTHMCFVTAGMGGGTGTGAAPVVARAARERGILTVGVVTKPFHFEGQRRMRTADAGIEELQQNVDTLIVIPNQNLFRIANDKTTFADAFGMADQVLYSGVACITDLMVKEGLINLDFADVRSVMREMGKAMMGTGEASGEGRAITAAEAAIANPLLDETSMRGARGLLISITGGRDMTLFEVDEAATRIREEVDQDANIILGATFDESLEGIIRVSVVATGIETDAGVTENDLLAQPRATTATAARVAVTAQAPVSKLGINPSPAPKVSGDEALTKELMEETERDTENYESRLQTRPAAAAEDIAFRPQSRLFQQSAQQPMAAQPSTSPVQPEAHAEPAPVTEKPRLPRVEDFPPVVQAELESNDQRSSVEAEDDRGPLGLLKRLTHGLSRPEERPGSSEGPQKAQGGDESSAASPRRPLSRDAQLYAPRKGQLDDQGRTVKDTNHASDDDQLEIPAFLRRQAN